MSSEYEFRSRGFATENFEQYCEGGFHPVRVGFLFRGRYFIKGKVGFGGFGTVWCAKDIVTEQLIAIKIITASASENCGELMAFYYLSETERTQNHPGREHLVKLIRSFWHKGPNGNHLCLVLELAGPKIQDFLKYRPKRVGLRGLQKIALDTANALAYLHANGFVHGDLTANNVLLRLADPQSWNAKQMDSLDRLCHEATSELVQRIDGNPPGPHAPKIVTQELELWKLDPSCMTSNIVVADLGASFPAHDPPESDFVLPPIKYCAPELLTQTIPRPPDMQTDIWGLACTIFTIRAGRLLFPTTNDPDQMWLNLYLVLGDLPPSLQHLWTMRSKLVADDGTLKDGTTVQKPLRRLIQEIGTSLLDHRPGSDEAKLRSGSHGDIGKYSPDALEEKLIGIKLDAETEGSMPIPVCAAEVDSFHDLLTRMLQFDPDKRILVEEVVQHRWFSMEFLD